MRIFPHPSRDTKERVDGIRVKDRPQEMLTIFAEPLMNCMFSLSPVCWDALLQGSVAFACFEGMYLTVPGMRSLALIPKDFYQKWIGMSRQF